MSNSLLPTLPRALPFLLASLVALAAQKPSTAAACSCVQPPGPKDAAQNSTAVFEGRVTRIDDPQGEPKVHFKMVRSFKGPSSESIEVRTANSSAACGYGFEEGQSYLVYANDFEGTLSASLCSRTRLITEATEDLNELGLGVTPFDPGPGSDQKTPPAASVNEAPKKGGCASCTIGAHEHGAADSKRSLGTLALLVLGAAYRITSRRRSGSRS